ncbi:CaiB/BaiF CoA transferase family protein [Shouchella shacheensis]|uniref:CaiB/BaiF CoA transferase family protein n=1 Tax=Shouchella shacheensis TaxID=1649580 RepID=UPI000740301E|nr:CoA transferase [Shouchella shacheensis]
MPLTSIRILDLTRLLPGPYCTMLLADFGAEVIKVEDPKVGDYARAYEPKLGEDSALFHSLNRNKKSICVNLKSEEGKEQFLKLVENADVVVESFRPGVMERLGLGYEPLNTVNPALIYCAITGYGQTGPYADRPGHDINYLSYAGLLNLMGEKDGKPVVPAAQLADIGGGALPAAVGILLALFERERSGKGQFIDVSMMDGVISWLQTLLPNYLVEDVEPRRGEQVLSGGLACYEVYETKDGRFLSVGALEPKFWQSFCQVIDRRDFIPLLDAPLHEQHRLKYEIQTIISQRTLAEWLDNFSGKDACVAPVLNFHEMVNDPQVLAREMIQSVHHSTLGGTRQIGIPIKLSETPGKIQSQAPKLGEHTAKVMEEIEISRKTIKEQRRNV